MVDADAVPRPVISCISDCALHQCLVKAERPGEVKSLNDRRRPRNSAVLQPIPNIQQSCPYARLFPAFRLPVLPPHRSAQRVSTTRATCQSGLRLQGYVRVYYGPRLLFKSSCTPHQGACGIVVSRALGIFVRPATLSA
jgi:hypothetical protein